MPNNFELKEAFCTATLIPTNIDTLIETLGLVASWRHQFVIIRLELYAHCFFDLNLICFACQTSR